MATTNIKNDFNVRDHDGSAKGLKLGGTLVTSTAAELNIMDGVLATAAELNRACQDSTRVVNVTAATLTVTLAAHDKKFITLNRAAGIGVTLPAAAGTGAVYVFFLNTTVTSNSTTIKVANSSDVMTGFANVISDNSAAMLGYKAGATDDTITLNGTTTGGIKGDLIVVRDVATNLFHVQVFTSATGTEATPFSATV